MAAILLTDETKNADKVGSYLKNEHHLKTLIIHTDTKGVITKKGLDEPAVPEIFGSGG